MGVLMVLLWAVSLVRGVTMAAAFTIALLPFGMAAVVNLPALGGLSLLAAQVCAGLTAGVALVVAFTANAAETKFRVGPASLALICLCAYGLVSAFVMPRLFQGEVMVVPMARALQGDPSLGVAYNLAPLGPSSSNLSQPAYLIGSTMFFIVLSWVLKLRGAGFMHAALITAAIVNLVLTGLDVIGLDPLLALFRTANYALADSQYIIGVRRTIGGFSEASALGQFTTGLFAFFASLALDRRRPLDIALALGSGLVAVATFASTAIFGVSFVVALLTLRSLNDIAAGRMGREPFFNGSAIAAFGFLTAVCVISLTPLRHVLFQIIDMLVLQKSTSGSGIERGAWAYYGFQTFLETYGFGAGLGSIRANGTPSVILGNMGLPGALCLAAFFWFVFVRPLPKRAAASATTAHHRAYFRAAFAGGLSVFAMQCVSATIADPGLLFMSFAALAAYARLRIRQETHVPSQPQAGALPAQVS